MPEPVVAPEPAAEPKTPLNFGIPDTDVVVEGDPPPAEERPRDDQGRFIKPGEVDPDTTPEVEGEPGGEPAEGGEPEGDPAPASGLDVGHETPPTFNHEGQFVGGKFLGKHDTLDSALQGYKNAAKRIGQLEYELKEARSAPAPVADGTVSATSFVYDPNALTSDALLEAALKELGGDGEMSLDDRLAREENPNKFDAERIIKVVAKVQAMTAEKSAFAKQWSGMTRERYVNKPADPNMADFTHLKAVFDDALAEGEREWKLIAARKYGPDELKVLIGLGSMVRSKKLSFPGKTPKTRAPGRAPVTRGAVPVPSPKGTGDPRAEQKAVMAELQASY